MPRLKPWPKGQLPPLKKLWGLSPPLPFLNSFEPRRLKPWPEGHITPPQKKSPVTLVESPGRENKISQSDLHHFSAFAYNHFIVVLGSGYAAVLCLLKLLLNQRIESREGLRAAQEPTVDKERGSTPSA